MTEIDLKIRIGSGRRQTVTAPLDINTSDFLEQVVLGLKLGGGVNGHQAKWVLVDPDTGQALQPKKTLRENRVHAGQELILQDRPSESEPGICARCAAENAPGNSFCVSCGYALKEPLSATNEVRHEPSPQYATDHSAAPPLPRVTPADIQFFVHLDDGAPKQYEVPGGMLAEQFLAQISGASPTANCTLYDKDAGIELVPFKSLYENGVRNGHTVYIRRSPVAITDPNREKKILSKPRTFNWKVPAAIFLTALLALIALVVLRPAPPTISLSPATADLTLPATQQFSAAVTGKPAKIVWSLSPAIGTINPQGLYLPPPSIPIPSTVTVNAAVDGKPAISASSQITLHPARGVLDLSPLSASLKAAETLAFSAKITAGIDHGVTWSIQPPVGSISSDGVYTAPVPVGDVQALDVKATSVADPDRTVTAHVTLEPVSISLRPRTATIPAGSPLHIVATLTGTANHGIRWSLSGVGMISKDGTYAAPSDLNDPATAQITATSSADTTKSASLIVKIMPVVAIKLTPSSGAIVDGQRQRFQAAVSGTQKTSVKWSLTGPGTLSQDGEYQSPGHLSTEATAHITAVSEADSTKTAVANLTIRPVVLSISPATAELRASQSIRFTASSSAGSGFPIRWVLFGGKGSLTPDGVYTAPATISADQIIRVVAASSADPSRSIAAIVTLRKYSGPPSGALIWSGPTNKNGSITIEGNQVSAGSLRGELPGVPVNIKLDSRDFEITLYPSLPNSWKRLVFNSKKTKSSSEVRIVWSVIAETK